MNRILKKLSSARQVLVAMLFGSAVSAVAADKVYISDFGIKAGERMEVAIRYDGDATKVKYLQGKLTLPKGLTLIEDAYGKNVRVRTDEDRAPGGMGNLNPETHEVIIASLDTFTGSEGPVAYITVESNRYLPETGAKIDLEDFTATTPDDKTVELDEQDAKVTRTTPLAWLQYKDAMTSMEMLAGETADIEVEMTNVVDVTFLQASLTASQGIEIVEVKASNRISGVNHKDGDIYIFPLVEKPAQAEDVKNVTGTKGTLFTIKVKAAKGLMGKYWVKVSNAVASEPTAVTHKPKDITLEVIVRDAELKAKCDSIAKAASEQLEAALKHIAERDTDVVEKYEKESMPIGQQLVQLQKNINDAYQDLSLNEKDVKEAADKIAAAIKALQDAADAEQKQIEEERAKKAANDAAYKKLSDELAALQAQLDAAKKDIADNDPDVAKDFEETLNGIQKQLDDAKKALEDKNAKTELTADSKLEGVDGVPAAIEKAKADADAAEAAFKKKQANDAAYKQLSDELAALQAQLDSAKAAISEKDPDVAKDFEDELAAIQKQLDDAKKALEEKNAAGELTAEDKLEGVDGIPAAIEQTIADADAAQKAYEENQEKIAENQANYDKIKPIFDEAQALLDGAKKHIDENCAEVAKDFAERLQKLQDDVNTGRAIVDSLYKAVALVGIDSVGYMDEFVKDVEQLVKDADAAQKAFVNQANYDKIKPVFDEAQALLDGVKKHIEENCADVAKDFAERIQKLQDDLNTGRAIVDSLYKAVALVGIDSVGYADEFVKDVEQLKADADAAQQAWIIAHQKIFEEGVYYLQNVATGKFLAAGHSWGTQAIVNEDGLDFTAAFTPEGKYTFDSKVSNGGNSHFLGSNLYTDSGAFGWTVAEVSKGVYTLSNGTQFAGVDAEDNIVWHAESCDSAQWKLVTYAERVQALENARIANPLNATFLVQDPGFSRNDQRVSAWTGDGFSVGGDATNTNAEKWGGNSQTFDIKQTVEVPNGVYKITWNGFYRYNNTGDNTNDIAVAAHADGTEVINSFVYINDKDYALTSIADEAASAALEGKIPFSQGDASAAFGQGLYAQEAEVVVADGQLTIGIKKTEHPGTDWTVWDNFRVTYMGPVQEVADGDYYLQHVATGKYLAAGHDWGTRAIVNADGLDFTLAMTNDGKYTLDSKVSNGGNSHFLGTNLYTDAGAYGWTVDKVRDGNFTIGNGEQLLTIDADDNLAMTAENDGNAVWKFVTYAERVKALEGATKQDPKNATFVITDANFGRNDLRKEAWEVTYEGVAYNLSGGDNTNMAAEAYMASYDVKQTISGLPNGIYKVEAQAAVTFHDNRVIKEYDGNGYPVIYANDKTSNFNDMVEADRLTNMNQICGQFIAGQYEVEPITVEVTDGTLTVGTKSDRADIWAMWDNFRLTYLGVATNPDDPELEAPTGWIAEVSNGNLAGDGVSNYVAKEAPSSDIVGARIVDGAGKNNSRGIVVKSQDKVSVAWESQFWIVLNEPLTAGAKLHVEFDYKADKAGTVGTQAHGTPGNYQHWAAIGNVNFTAEWQHFSADVDVTSEMAGANGMLSIAFNLNDIAEADVFYFDNFGVWAQTAEMVGIEGVTLKQNDGAIYDLRGRKVEGTLRKGIYIQNGKKIMVK